jgi:spore coat polysaccharide biosynthesis protein SpsF
MKIVVLIQARMGSKRLPNKMMLSLHGKPILEWVIRRVQNAKRVDEVILATSENSENDILELTAERLGISTFRGSEDDVLNRFYLAGKGSGASHIVRVCADNPLIDGVEIDRLIDFYFKNSYSYVYNHIPKENLYPDGLGAEITSFEILEEMEKVVKSPKLREHSFSYIWENERFSIGTFNPPEEIAFPELRFDVDTFQDYYYLSSKEFSIDISSKELIKLFNI